MGHGADAREVTGARRDPEALRGVAETLHALAAPSRLAILLRLRDGDCTVGELAGAVAMEQSAVSHQLRVLRHLGLVVGTRDGKSIRYRLHDEHVAQLLDEAVFHVEHRRAARAAAPEPTP